MTDEDHGATRLGRRALLGGAGSLLLAGACSPRGMATIEPVPGPPLDPSRAPSRIVFGSCLDQGLPQPIWQAIAAARPELLLMIGDNVYADAEDEATLREAYAALGRSEGFRQVRAQTPLLATWDDHDYGRDDAGSEYPLRDVSQRVMLDFFGEPADSPRRRRPGVYRADVLGAAPRRVQIILLDCRYFRSELRRGPSRGRYQRSDDPADTMLGAAQWSWLEEQLKIPAELRVLATSVQLLSDDHDYESWGVLPLERDRLLTLIRSTGASGLIVISGDRHHAELSALEGSAAGYPIYDLTSSSLNRPTPHPHELNQHRVGEMVDVANFGVIEVDWERGVVALRIHDERGAARLEHKVALASLTAPRA